jgi:hypothetical protein
VANALRRLSFHFTEVFVDGCVGKVLVLDEIPVEFLKRFGKIPNHILIRECYKELYDMVVECMIDPNRDGQTILFTGVPGVGKSLFMIYFICSFSIDEKFPDKKFAVEFYCGQYDVYVPTGVSNEYQYYRSTDGPAFPIFEFPVFADIATVAQPRAHGKCTLIFSSPNPIRYKEFMKTGISWTLTLPTWSEEELSLVEPVTEKWYDRFVQCGGVARIVLWSQVGHSEDPIVKFCAAFNEKGPLVASYFFKHGFGNVDQENSYHLVHINPPFSLQENRYQYDSEAIHSFASDYVFRRLSRMYHGSLIAEAANIFNAGGDLASNSLGASYAGQLFEKICLWLVPIAGKTICPESLAPDQFPLGAIVLPQVQTLPVRWYRLHQLEMGVLYQPQISNLESGDAFCLVSVDNICTLVVLQVTIAENHPIKSNGLNVIFEAFRDDLKGLIQRKLIVFVTPIDGKLYKIQPIHNQKNQVMDPNQLPLSVRGFEQWVYRHRIVQ